MLKLAGWRKLPLPFAPFSGTRLAKLVANSTRQRIDAESRSFRLTPRRGAHSDRPAARDDPGTVAITIRRPADALWSIGELASRGLFREARPATTDLDETETELQRLSMPVSTKRSCASRCAVAATSWYRAHRLRQDDFTKALIREIPKTSA